MVRAKPLLTKTKTEDSRLKTRGRNQGNAPADAEAVATVELEWRRRKLRSLPNKNQPHHLHLLRLQSLHKQLPTSTPFPLTPLFEPLFFTFFLFVFGFLTKPRRTKTKL